MDQYLAKIKEDNEQIFNKLFAKCSICDEPSETLQLSTYKVSPVCKDHIRK